MLRTEKFIYTKLKYLIFWARVRHDLTTKEGERKLLKKNEDTITQLDAGMKVKKRECTQADRRHQVWKCTEEPDH